MTKPKKPTSLESEPPHSAEHAFLATLAATTAPGMTATAAMAAVLPGDIKLQVDVQVCLLDAITDRFPVKRWEIGANTVPSKLAGADPQGWGICLATFGEYLRALSSFYAFYVHKPRYTEETIDDPFPKIVLYLKQKVLAQFSGTEE